MQHLLAATLLTLCAHAALAAPPDLAEGRVVLNFGGSDHDEAVLQCDGQWVMSWGAFQYVLLAEGDAWTAPAKMHCNAEGACKSAIRMFYANELGVERNRANAAAQALPDHTPPDPLGHEFYWRLTPATLPDDTKAFHCANLTPWEALPPAAEEY